MSVVNSLLTNGNGLIVSFVILSGIVGLKLLSPGVPIQGLVFVAIALFVWFGSLCVTFTGLHKLLQRKDPVSSKGFEKILQHVGVTLTKASVAKRPIKVNLESIKKLTADIDKYFISYWYCSISEDPSFPTETRVFIEEVLSHLLDTTFKVNPSSLIQGLLNVFLKHLKEFRKSLKRKEKYHMSIEDLYRYSHICSITGSKNSREYFAHHSTISLLCHFINSELWNSLPCHILVSILARKIVSYLLNLLSNPEVLNYIILNALITKKEEDRLNLKQYSRISIVEFFDIFDTVKKDEPEEAKNLESQKNVKEDEEELLKKTRELEKKVEKASIEHKLTRDTRKNGQNIIKEIPEETVVVRPRKQHKMADVDVDGHLEKSPKRSDPVKIYEPKNTIKTKTWRDSRDLACVSLGQDPLDMLDGISDNGGSKATSKPGNWDSTTTKSEDVKHDSPPSSANLFTDVIHMPTMEGLKTTIKPLSDATERTLHNIKDLQEATVNNALHKIGDFQVTGDKQIEPLHYLHYLPPNTLLHSSILSNTQRLLYVQPEDEAAGMVEGILDFGRAGFRKGLRLTGLQDNIETAKSTLSTSSAAKTMTKSVRGHVKKRLEDFKKSDTEQQEKTSSAESAESIWINPAQIDSPNYDGHILLEKAPSKPAVDESQIAKSDDFPVPSISTEDTSETDSPDPEYEDTADLASSIAKLRSLLQQRSSESSISTPALSPMPDDYIQKQIESENVSDIEPIELDGMMTNFYKVCTKTATGVFSNTLNTIKTALPSSVAENFYTVEMWNFKPQLEDSDTLIRMKKLLSERKEYCVLDKEIDAAYDALDSVDVYQQSPKLLPGLQFEDELDDLEGKMPITKAVFDIICELLEDANSSIIQEPIVKGSLLLFGSVIEQHITSFVDKGMDHLAKNLVTIPEKINSEVLSMDIENYVCCIEKSIPDSLKCLLGKDTFRQALKLLISSLQSPKVNQDVLLQGFELIVMLLIEESIRGSPPASA
ncbi:uncharacterized protein [Euwallacea similis]|uniref:uncharacterized protein isoform X2 n=1 Tax=Euwallacea similis TaxID=1736056 RepID=UPI00344E208D